MKGKKRVQFVAVNEQGYRIGASHHNARLPDEVIDKIRDMHEDKEVGYRKLAKIFDIPLSTIKKICKYERRAQTPDRWKKIIDETQD
jgi:DNA invertase Pin-like site-specific DNA recombinase